MKKIAMTMLLVIGLIGGASLAATVTLEMIGSTNSGAGDFDVFASVSGGAGLAGYGFELQNVNNASVLNMGPVGGSSVFFAQVGFSQARSADGDPIVTGGQNTTDPVERMAYGVGQTAGTLPGGPFGGSPLVQTTYGAPVLLASGTYNDATTIAFNTTTNLQANVFTTNDSTTAPDATMETDVTLLPEPVTMLVPEKYGVA